MTRLPLLAVGFVLLAGALVVEPAPREPARTALGALGRSLGGLRVLLADALFLRADALRRQGRLDDVAALYEAVRELEPDNPAAAEFLAGVMAYDLLADAEDLPARAAWWAAAWDLVAAARAAHPDDPSLMAVQADLLLDVPARHPEVRPAVDEAVPDRIARGLDLLLASARRAEVLPRRGRYALLVLSEAVPLIAASRLQAGSGMEDVLGVGDALLAARRDALETMTLPPASVDARPLSRATYLEEGLRTVRAVAAALHAGRPAEAEASLDAWRALAPASPLGDRLEDVLRGS